MKNYKDTISKSNDFLSASVKAKSAITWSYNQFNSLIFELFASTLILSSSASLTQELANRRRISLYSGESEGIFSRKNASSWMNGLIEGEEEMKRPWIDRDISSVHLDRSSFPWIQRRDQRELSPSEVISFPSLLLLLSSHLSHQSLPQFLRENIILRSGSSIDEMLEFSPILFIGQLQWSIQWNRIPFLSLTFTLGSFDSSKRNWSRFIFWKWLLIFDLQSPSHLTSLDRSSSLTTLVQTAIRSGLTKENFISSYVLYSFYKVFVHWEYLSFLTAMFSVWQSNRTRSAQI